MSLKPLPQTTARITPHKAKTSELNQGTLGVGSIVFMVIAAAAPLTVIGGALPIGIATGNGAGYPAMYALSGIVLMVFSVGLVTMSRRISEPGAFFSYVESASNRRWGIGTAFLAMLTYTVVQFAIYAYLGAQLSLLLTHIGVNLPWWIPTLTIVAIVGFLGYRDIELSSKALGAALIAEIAITLIVVVGIILAGGSNGLSAETFTPQAIMSGTPGVGLMLAFAGFIGFESTTVFRNEAKNPDRTIPRATYIAIAIIGLLYTLSGWAIVEAWGAENIAAIAAENPEEMVIITATRYVGPWAGVAVQILLLTSLFAAALSFHNVLTRYQHAIAKKGCLPQSVSLVHPIHNSPHISSLLQTLTIVVFTLCSLIAGLDPVLEIFTWFSGLATFAIVVLMIMVDIAIIKYFRSHPAGKDPFFHRIGAPCLSLIGLSVACFFITANLVSLVGGDSQVAWALALSVPLSVGSGWLCAALTPDPTMQLLTPEELPKNYAKHA
ncbi:APC family permease [Corynebacterium sp. sy039]|uniref:APC family permease n=1 Tax=Corynebacterium sp. sy039 TaxID=2599641 RepID=UPI0011B4A6A5|nr:APC family permease [Corynebacterium sp. sy039]QDZ43092.1 APC family permease [Corynebacterium sp. sy039]